MTWFALKTRAEPWLAKDQAFLALTFTSVDHNMVLMTESLFNQVSLKLLAELLIKLNKLFLGHQREDLEHSHRLWHIKLLCSEDTSSLFASQIESLAPDQTLTLKQVLPERLPMLHVRILWNKVLLFRVAFRVH